MLKPALHAEQLTFRDEVEVIEAFHARGWSDGLPIVPPTLARVSRFVAAAGLPAGEAVGVLPPLWAEATVENIAINAAMAGCLPEHMPVLIAAVRAAADPAFGLYSVQATTHPCAVLLVVTGPIVKALRFNCGHGVFGPGFRANAAVGRAMRLILINVGGARPGHGDQSTQGSPAKFSYCIAENEAAHPPGWQPYRIDKGFGPGDSTVTVFSGEGPHNIHDRVCINAHTILDTIASGMTTLGNNNVTGCTLGDLLVVLCPEHVHYLTAGGLAKEDIRLALYDRARSTVRQLRDRASVRMDNWPRWIDRHNDEMRVPIVGNPNDINLLVAGGPGKHSAFIPTFGMQRSVTRRIEWAGG